VAGGVQRHPEGLTGQTAGPLCVELVVLEPVRQQAIMVDEIAVRPV
jgi:hypothetical protein